MSHRGYDEHDYEHYERPRGRTRPRTKERPSYPNAVAGFVVTIDRGRYTCLLGDGTTVLAVKARSLGRQAVVVGDHVHLVGDVSGAEGTLARIVEVAQRTSALRRTADDTDPYERIVVANADQLVIVSALAEPPPRLGFIDRALTAAYDAGIEPLLCLTKADLAAPDDVLAVYAPLGVAHVVTRMGGDLTPLRDRLRGRVSVLLGQSGVGKSTLVNALAPGVRRSTGDVNVVTGRGRHVSTSVYAVALPFDGWVIDTPGIRSFGLAHVAPDDLLAAFADLDEHAADCPRGCTHGDAAPECALDAAAARRDVDPLRLDSFRRLLASRG